MRGANGGMQAAVLEYCEGPEGRRFLKGVAKPSPLKPGLYDLSGFFSYPGCKLGRAANSEGEERKVQSVSQRSVGAKAEQGRGGSWRGLTAGCPGEARVCRRLRRPSPHQSPHPKNPESMGGSVAHCVCVCRSLCVRVCACVCIK